MRIRFALGAALMLLAMTSPGCGKPAGPTRKKVIPVTGTVTVDGQPPSSPVQLECHDQAGMDKENPTFSRCETGEGGVFKLSTYVTGDGVPAGDYVLTFQWGAINPMSMQYSGDKFKGKYADAKKSEVKFKVTDSDKTIDVGKIELTTQ